MHKEVRAAAAKAVGEWETLRARGRAGDKTTKVAKKVTEGMSIVDAVGVLREDWAAWDASHKGSGALKVGDKVHSDFPQAIQGRVSTGHNNGIVREVRKPEDVITSSGSERAGHVGIQWADGDYSFERPEDVLPGHHPQGGTIKSVKPGSGQLTAEKMIANYRKMHGRDPDPKVAAKLRKKYPVSIAEALGIVEPSVIQQASAPVWNAGDRVHYQHGFLGRQRATVTKVTGSRVHIKPDDRSISATSMTHNQAAVKLEHMLREADTKGDFPSMQMPKVCPKCGARVVGHVCQRGHRVDPLTEAVTLETSLPGGRTHRRRFVSRDAAMQVKKQLEGQGRKVRLVENTDLREDWATWDAAHHGDSGLRDMRVSLDRAEMMHKAGMVHHHPGNRRWLDFDVSSMRDAVGDALDHADRAGVPEDHPAKKALEKASGLLRPGFVGQESRTGPSPDEIRQAGEAVSQARQAMQPRPAGMASPGTGRIVSGGPQKDPFGLSHAKAYTALGKLNDAEDAMSHHEAKDQNFTNGRQSALSRLKEAQGLVPVGHPARQHVDAAVKAAQQNDMKTFHARITAATKKLPRGW